MASLARVNAVLKNWKPGGGGVVSSASYNSYTSPPFKSEASPDIGWRLKVTSGNSEGSNCNHGGTADQCKACAQCLEFSLELEGGGDPKKLEPELSLTVAHGDYESYVRKTDPSSLLPSKVHFKKGIVKDPSISATVSFTLPVKRRVELGTPGSKWCGRILSELHFADFEVRVGEERIPIHRALFAAASPVFARMFERDMEEKAQGFVVIEDASAKAIAGLRAFVYTGDVAEVLADLPTFLHLGEKYDIRELKAFCHDELRIQLSSANLCELAGLADKYGLDELFEDCRRLVKGKDWGDLSVPKEHWDRLLKDGKDLALKLLGPYRHH